ncbi:S-Ena type endospore appendage [Alkalibacillus haloalkaliphilus]|uniref:Endospore appendages core domain-containing protein n=1 Tax=Alkalibacillus haloalkaliphilus TaxID=94136 RepID=A0A511W7V1_9BACI|nr:S-Ena type endospore appendage [Alkalibacillus haloalkaliphilus]GEN46133.1 hypothetical protein AHA02nite_19090 [Alkalibacillus haloalkaliphilus]
MGNCTTCHFDKPGHSLVSDDFCGNFLVPCDGEMHILWQLDPSFFAGGAQSAGTVSIYYGHSCDEDLTVIITREDFTTEQFQVSNGNTRSLTVLNLNSVAIVCPNQNQNRNRCEGKYCIDLHYAVE